MWQCFLFMWRKRCYAMWDVIVMQKYYWEAERRKDFRLDLYPVSYLWVQGPRPLSSGLMDLQELNIKGNNTQWACTGRCNLRAKLGQLVTLPSTQHSIASKYNEFLPALPLWSPLNTKGGWPSQAGWGSPVMDLPASQLQVLLHGTNGNCKVSWS